MEGWPTRILCRRRGECHRQCGFSGVRPTLLDYAHTLTRSLSANAFAIFLKSQRKWESNALKDESIAKFKERMKTFGYSPAHILPHGSYLVNLGNPDKLVSQ